LRVGAVDIGTNSVRLLIANREGGELIRLQEELRVPRLGAGVSKQGYLTQAAIERTMKTLNEYKGLIDDFEASSYLVATSAVREAENKEDFLSRVSQELNLTVEVVSGRQEAYLSYLGIVSELSELSGSLLAVDIGGGSTELIKGEKFNFNTSQSLDLGAIKLREKFHDNIARMKKEAEEKINSIGEEYDKLAGVGGTITTLASIKQALPNYDRDKLQGVILRKLELKQMLVQLSKLRLSERRQVIGLAPDRADIIIPGLVILLVIMDQSKKQELFVSTSGILEGIIYNNT
jgi:exopolyphosphatase/guanosine-5'-triphosphate,3'-diphosphate pyrophosphatase